MVTAVAVVIWDGDENSSKNQSLWRECSWWQYPVISNHRRAQHLSTYSKAAEPHQPGLKSSQSWELVWETNSVFLASPRGALSRPEIQKKRVMKACKALRAGFYNNIWTPSLMSFSFSLPTNLFVSSTTMSRSSKADLQSSWVEVLLTVSRIVICQKYFSEKCLNVCWFKQIFHCH